MDEPENQEKISDASTILSGQANEDLIKSGSSSVSTVSNGDQHLDLKTEDVKHKILTEKALVIARPHVKNTIRSYLIVKQEENDFKNKPEWDSYEHCLMKDMIETKKNNKLAFEALRKKLEEQAKTYAERQREIHNLQKDEKQFGASFMYFDKFVKENIEKRERAIEKINSEKAIRAELDEQIVETDHKVQKLLDIKQNMAKCINDRKIFVDFLEEVRQKAPDEFRNGVHEIAERYEVLTMIREDLAKEQAEAIETMEQLNHTMCKITDNHTEELINLRNKHTELSCRYDSAKHDALYWESLLNKIEGMVADETLERARTKNALYLRYTQICQERNIPATAAKNDIRKHLSVIEDNILLFRRVLYIIKKKHEKERPRHNTRPFI